MVLALDGFQQDGFASASKRPARQGLSEPLDLNAGFPCSKGFHNGDVPRSMPYSSLLAYEEYFLRAHAIIPVSEDGESRLPRAILNAICLLPARERPWTIRYCAGK